MSENAASSSSRNRVGEAESMSPPPALDDADLIVRLWRGANVEIHRWRRSSSISADAGRVLPASADDQDLRSASCRA